MANLIPSPLQFDPIDTRVMIVRTLDTVGGRMTLLTEVGEYIGQVEIVALADVENNNGVITGVVRGYQQQIPFHWTYSDSVSWLYCHAGYGAKSKRIETSELGGNAYAILTHVGRPVVSK